MTTAEQIDDIPRPGWFVASFALYVTLGVLFKSTVLNWVVGPLWLVLTLWLVPALARRVRDAMGGS